MITTITPRMQKALRDGKKLRFFADIDLRVLNDTVDTQSDFQASLLQSNIDFTNKPGFATLSREADSIYQTSRNAEYPVTNVPGSAAWQSFVLPHGRWMNTIAVWLDRTGALTTANVTLTIYNYDKTVPLLSSVLNLGAGDSEEIYPFSKAFLEGGTYWMHIDADKEQSQNFVCQPNYQDSNVYADGQYDHFNKTENGGWSYNQGDLYFKLDMQQYASSGFFRTRTLDMGEQPPGNGKFQISYRQPFDAGLSITLYGSDTGAFAGEETTIPNAQDGTSIPPHRYWQVYVLLTTNAGRDVTTEIDVLGCLYPKDQLLVREAFDARYIQDALLDKYEAILSRPKFTPSEIKLVDRVASGETTTLKLETPTPDTIMRAVSDSPLKNFDITMYVGADVPGFNSNDLLQFFVGVIDDVTYRPRYRKNNYGLELSLKNPILKLTQKIPLPSASGSVDQEELALNYDGDHVMDVMIDAMRGEAEITARSINLDSFINGRTTIGDANLPAAAHTVRRSNAVGLPDSRIKSAEETRNILTPLAFIADGYITFDEASRITFVKHDASAAAEGLPWADEAMVKDGVDAIRMEAVDSINLGYKERLFNLVIMAAEWDGSGSDWSAFGEVKAGLNGRSVTTFAPGDATFYSPMEKNLVNASKWLGPEAGYNGETIAQALCIRISSRFAFPPVIMKGVQVPLSEFMRTPGSIVQVWSNEFVKFERQGIRVSETLTFMVIKKEYKESKEEGQDRMVFDLLELT